MCCLLDVSVIQLVVADCWVDFLQMGRPKVELIVCIVLAKQVFFLYHTPHSWSSYMTFHPASHSTLMDTNEVCTNPGTLCASLDF